MMYDGRVGTSLIMGLLRDFFGFMLALVMCAIGLGLAWLAWQGIGAEFGVTWAALALALSIFARVNLFTVLGAFFYARHSLGWSDLESFGLAAVGLLFITPAIATEVLTILTGLARR